jgi:hypothetical protein
MHALQVPFSGMVVSCMAVMCIIAISYFVPSRKFIWQATLIVAIFKLILSPHSPPTAYLAVGFQGLMGTFLLGKGKFETLRAAAFGGLALVESAGQRLLVLWLLYGKTFWKAFDEFVVKAIGMPADTRTSISLAIGYLIIHLLIGIGAGLYSVHLFRQVAVWKPDFNQYILPQISEYAIQTKHRSMRSKKVLLIVWLLLGAIWIYGLAIPQNKILPGSVVFNILLRSFLIILTWYLLVSPFIMRLIKSRLEKAKAEHAERINEVSGSITRMKPLISGAWRVSAVHPENSRIGLFAKIILINVLYSDYVDRPVPETDA